MPTSIRVAAQSHCLDAAKSLSGLADCLWPLTPRQCHNKDRIAPVLIQQASKSDAKVAGICITFNLDGKDIYHDDADCRRQLEVLQRPVQRLLNGHGAEGSVKLVLKLNNTTKAFLVL